MDDKIIQNISYKICDYVENLDNINFDLFLHNIISYMINEMNLQNYVSNVVILDSYDENPSSKGCYDTDNRVCIFKRGVENITNQLLEEAPYLSDLEITICKLILYIKTAIHEIQHAKQKKMLDEDTENHFFETMITRLSERGKSINSFGYFCSYNIYPTERLADITANRNIEKVLDALSKIYDIEKLACLIKRTTTKEEFYQYYEYGLSGPTIHYFSVFNKDSYSDLEKKIESSNITMEDRVLYGFEITRKEYEELVTKYAEYDDKTTKFSGKQPK